VLASRAEAWDEERAQAEACATVHGKCHREYTAGREKHGGILQENLKDVFEMLAQLGKGEKVG
jgi:hypothetical protein